MKVIGHHEAPAALLSE